jgi:hypothetical protein
VTSIRRLKIFFSLLKREEKNLGQHYEKLSTAATCLKFQEVSSPQKKKRERKRPLQPIQMHFMET